MRFPELSRLQQSATWFRRRPVPQGGLILLYHRVIEGIFDPFRLSVTPKHFAEHLEVLKQFTHPNSLRGLVQNIRDGAPLNRMVAITFDDGYTDNLTNVKPLLENYNIPATVFVATGFLEKGREFWWDELERILLQPGKLPQILCLVIDGSTYEWNLGTDSQYTEDAFEHNQTWSWYCPETDDPGQRQHLYRQLYLLLQSVSVEERQRLLNDLVSWSGIQHKSRSTHCSLLPSEIYTLQQGPLIEIGAHTVNHPFLSRLPLSQQQYELGQSKTILEEIIECPVTSFAYPHGDYTSETVTLAREAGFACACSTICSKVAHDTDVFRLPRVEMQDWDGEEFARQISKLLSIRIC